MPLGSHIPRVKIPRPPKYGVPSPPLRVPNGPPKKSTGDFCAELSGQTFPSKFRPNMLVQVEGATSAESSAQNFPSRVRPNLVVLRTVRLARALCANFPLQSHTELCRFTHREGSAELSAQISPLQSQTELSRFTHREGSAELSAQTSPLQSQTELSRFTHHEGSAELSAQTFPSKVRPNLVVQGEGGD